MIFAKTDDQRRFLRFVLSTTEFGRPYVLPPDVPKDWSRSCARRLPTRRRTRSWSRKPSKMKLDMIYTPPERLERLRGEPLRDAAGDDRSGQEARAEPVVCRRTSVPLGLVICIRAA